MRRVALLLLVLSAAPLRAADPFAPLAAYSGSWQVTQKNAPPGKLDNRCVPLKRFFVCEQTVNGDPGNLLIFIAIPEKPGHFYTQNVRIEGQASSRGELEVEGNVWIFRNTWNQGGSTIYYRTTNTFTGRNKIQFEQAESTDNKTWTVKNTGEDVRLSAAPR